MKLYSLKAFTLLVLCLALTAARFKTRVVLSAESFKDCVSCPEMINIPGGSFLMGAPMDEPGRFDEEGPQRSISITKFAIGKFDVTRGQWAAFVSATNRTVEAGCVCGCAWSGFSSDRPWDPNPNASWKNVGFDQDDKHPAVCLSWKDVNDYILWLNKITGEKYRLPTEAEWEYAARAGTATAYPWGSTATHEFANYGLDTAFAGFASGRDKWVHTSPVGSFPPNAFGLYDMNGNVMQYVQDCFSPSYSNLPADGSAYKTETILKLEGQLKEMTGKGSCEFRIIRGGDYGNPPKMIRSASRNWTPGSGLTLDNYRSAGLGFRVAKSL